MSPAAPIGPPILIVSLGIDFGVHVVYGLIPGDSGDRPGRFTSNSLPSGEHTRESTALSMGPLGELTTVRSSRSPGNHTTFGWVGEQQGPLRCPRQEMTGIITSAAGPFFFKNSSTVEVEGDVTAELQNQP